MTKAPSPSSAKTHSSLKPVARTRRPWKGEEDRKLESYVSSFGQKKAINWKGVACHLPGRTAKDCQKRWKHALNKAYSKGTWSIHEDLKLREGYLLFPEQWVKISVHVGTRSNDQCSKRWREVLDPCIHKGNWSLEEDRLLLELFTRCGTSWHTISKSFPGRPALHCRNRCIKLLEACRESRPVSRHPSSSHSHHSSDSSACDDKQTKKVACSPSTRAFHPSHHPRASSCPVPLEEERQLSLSSCQLDSIQRGVSLVPGSISDFVMPLQPGSPPSVYPCHHPLASNSDAFSPWSPSNLEPSSTSQLAFQGHSWLSQIDGLASQQPLFPSFESNHVFLDDQVCGGFPKVEDQSLVEEQVGGGGQSNQTKKTASTLAENQGCRWILFEEQEDDQSTSKNGSEPTSTPSTDPHVTPTLSEVVDDLSPPQPSSSGPISWSKNDPGTLRQGRSVAEIPGGQQTLLDECSWWTDQPHLEMGWWWAL